MKSTGARMLDTQALLELPLHGWHLIEANAGTGKTYTLANLYLRLILAGRRPDEILVVTFTRAATAELKERLQQRLQQALSLLAGQTEGDESLRLLLKAQRSRSNKHKLQLTLQLALNRMDQAQITTIHGFCAQVLQQLPLDSGQSPALEIETDENSRQQAIRDWLRVHGMQTPLPEPLLWDFARTRGLDRPERLEKMIRPLLQPTRPRLQPQPVADWKSLHARLQRELQQLQRQWQDEQEQIRQCLLEHPSLSRNRNSGLPVDTIMRDWPRLEAWWHAPGVAVPEWVSRYCSQQQLLARHKPSQREKKPLELSFCQRFDHFLQRQAGLWHACIQAIADWIGQRERLLRQARSQLSQDDLLSRVEQALAHEEYGPLLAERLRASHPVALIDEFQDTDATQYRIFSNIYQAGGENENCREMLVFIGDPKQSIYRFRGSDIHTYLRAAVQIPPANRWQLNINWRSCQPLIEGVNQLFAAHAKSWVFDEMHYHPSQPPPAPQAQPLQLDGKPLPATHCWLVEFSDRADEEIAEAVAARISTLLQLAAQGRLKLNDEPLQAQDIAVLVRKHQQATLVKRALTRLGMGAASQARDNIWQSREAADMERILDVLLQPGSQSAARNLLAAGFLALPPEAQWQWQQNDTRWGEWLDHLRTAARLAGEQGFMAGYQYLLQSLQLEQAVARHAQPMRMLGNLQQLAELLQQDMHAGSSLAGLRHILAQRRQQQWNEAWEPRMEGQRAQVQILTIHKAKGLQFPVVFAPWLEARTLPARAEFVEWHENGRPHWALGELAGEQARKQAAREALAEDIRLAYVALTRAESAVWTCWGKMGKKGYGQQALTWLLTGSLHWKPEGQQEMERLLQRHWPAASTEPLPGQPVPLYGTQAGTAPGPVQCNRFSRSLVRNWRWHSFSSLTRTLGHVTQPILEPPEDPLPVALSFPAGPGPGNLLHALLERLDYGQPVADQLPSLLPGLCLRHGVNTDEIQMQALASWLEHVLETPLTEQGPALKDIPASQRLHEMPFKLACDRIALHPLQEKGLLPERLEEGQLAGLLTGIIDLVFSWEGRWHLLDFKSNLLGYHPASYQHERLQQAMTQHHYNLQYHIYALALHRHLRQRLPDYDPDRHFGQVHYLFLRGMRGRKAPGSGILGIRLERERLEWLDQRVFPWQGRRKK